MLLMVVLRFNPFIHKFPNNKKFIQTHLFWSDNFFYMCVICFIMYFSFVLYSTWVKSIMGESDGNPIWKTISCFSCGPLHIRSYIYFNNIISSSLEIFSLCIWVGSCQHCLDLIKKVNIPCIYLGFGNLYFTWLCLSAKNRNFVLEVAICANAPTSTWCFQILKHLRKYYKFDIQRILEQ